MRKRALLVGIDDYGPGRSLNGCVNDVTALEPLLAVHDDGSTNFQCRRLVSTEDKVQRARLRLEVDRLLAPAADVALFYFAGHGASGKNDVTLVTQESDPYDPGVAVSEILGKIAASEIPQIIVVLDCCFSGASGRVPQLGGDVAVVKEGLAILTAARSDQIAAETSTQRGAFSSNLGDALNGGAADVIGNVSLAGIYAYLIESFDAWEQRPTFKANLDEMYSLRQCTPAVPITELRRLTTMFTEADAMLPLDPSYEPTAEPRDAAHEEVFGVLQRYRAAKLVEPVGETHLYFAAMKSGACRLTPLGRHYWQMAKKNLI
jgi:Caspase domain.